MISYALAATAAVEAQVTFLAAMPGDGAIAALTGKDYLAVINGVSPTVGEHGDLYDSYVDGLGVVIATGAIYVSLPSMNCVAVLSARDDSRYDINNKFAVGPTPTTADGPICVPPAGPEIYIATGSPAGGGIAAIDTVGKSIGFLALVGTADLLQIMADPNGGRLFARTLSGIYVVDLATRGVRCFIEGYVTAMTVSPDGNYLYLLYLPPGSPPRVDVVGTSTLTVLSSIGVTDCDDVSGLAVSADGVHLLLAGSALATSPGGRDALLVVKEVATSQTVTTVELGAASSYGKIVVSPDGSLIYIDTTEPTMIAVIQRKVELLFLDVKITVGSAPAWLVSRYAVQCTYTTLTGDHTCATADFDAGGGTATGQVSDEGGHFPVVVNIAVTIDFTPDSGLAGIVRNFTPAVTDVGVNFLFEPDQMMQTVELVFDLTSPPAQPNDFFSIQWQHHVGDDLAGTGTAFLSGQDLASGPVVRTDITLMPVGAPGTLAVTIQGRYQGAVLTTYSGSFDVLNTAVVLRPQPAAEGGYTLAVAT